MGFSFTRRVETRSDLKTGLADMVAATGPCFLEVVCDVDEMLYPRIPAGLGYKDMILGPYMQQS
jgi:acetolactate synthase I/II/III large subunit